MLKLIVSLSNPQKRIVILILDCIVVIASLYLSFSAQFGLSVGWNAVMAYSLILPYLLICTVCLALYLDFQHVQLASYDANSTFQMAALSAGVGLSAYILSMVANVRIDMLFYITLSVFFFVLSAVSRALLLQIVQFIYRHSKTTRRVLIYGAGITGKQLVFSMRNHANIDPIAFVDDNSALHGIKMSGLPVLSPLRIKEIVQEFKVDRVLLAVPSLSQPKQLQIANRLQKLGLEVQAIPSFSQLIGEEALFDKLTPIEPNLFLNRDEIAETFNDARNSYTNRNLLITGAGGSIGAELSRQVLEANPRRLVLFELSEFALFRIDMEIRELVGDKEIEVISILGSITDTRQVRKVLNDYNIQIILHAAAYKHVPLVEANPLSGLANNVLGTQSLALAALEAGIERFVLISSDKAVRPTNIMGASKRLAELILQDLSSRVPETGGPIFSMVRFGNVLGSSGSVIPLFQDQLKRGGPLTVTHPDVARYFMTIREAVTLVLRAGAMAEGGEVFVLDMGRPIQIEKLARQIIENAGYTVRSKENPEGDIEIAFTGLRPGEKLVEELSINGNLRGTNHKKIFSSDEDKLSEFEVAAVTRNLRQALVNGDESAARAVAKQWVEGYTASTENQLQTPKDT
ncbi:MAG: nucleoside-diphosphate sugar epimerase/dehydratase [Lentilitoribacter sp.]